MVSLIVSLMVLWLVLVVPPPSLQLHLGRIRRQPDHLRCNQSKSHTAKWLPQKEPEDIIDVGVRTLENRSRQRLRYMYVEGTSGIEDGEDLTADLK